MNELLQKYGVFTLNFMRLFTVSNMGYVPACGFLLMSFFPFVICNYKYHTHFIEFLILALLESHLSKASIHYLSFQLLLSKELLQRLSINTQRDSGCSVHRACCALWPRTVWGVLRLDRGAMPTSSSTKTFIKSII